MNGLFGRVKMPLRFCLGALVLLAVLYAGWSRAGSYPAGGVVKAVFDGDTILLDTGNKVRYLGIDCPETAHDGNPAECRGSRGTEAERTTGAPPEDRPWNTIGRRWTFTDACWLTWFYPTAGASMPNCSGRGTPVSIDPQKASGAWGNSSSCSGKPCANARGMWGACEVKPADSYTGNRHSYVFHRPNCTFGRDTSRRNLVRFKRGGKAWNRISTLPVCKP